MEKINTGIKDATGKDLYIGDKIIFIGAEPWQSEQYRRMVLHPLTITTMSTLGGSVFLNFSFPSVMTKGYVDDCFTFSFSKNALANPYVLKIEENCMKDCKFRNGDKIAYYTTANKMNRQPVQIGTVSVIVGGSEFSKDLLFLDNGAAVYNEDVLFLLSRKEYRVGDKILGRECINQSINQGEIVKITTNAAFLTLLEKEEHYSWSIDAEGQIEERYRDVYNLTGKTKPYFYYNEFTAQPIEALSVPVARMLLKDYVSSREQYKEGYGKINTEEVEEDDIIHPHNYEPETFYHYFSKGDDREETPLFGLEIELDCEENAFEDDFEKEKEIVKDLLNNLNKGKEIAYAVKDGSIEGVEIVTQPMSYKFITTHKEKEFNNFFNLAVNEYYYDNESGRAGTHVHISSSYFGKSNKEKSVNLAKLVYLLYKYKDNVDIIAERKPNQYCTYCGKVMDFVKQDDIFGAYAEFYYYAKKSEDEETKYSSLNILHKESIEFRMFQGSIYYEQLIEYVEFVYKICKITKNTSMLDIYNVTWEDIMAIEIE